MAITVSFNISDSDERAAVSNMIFGYDTSADDYEPVAPCTHVVMSVGETETVAASVGFGEDDTLPAAAISTSDDVPEYDSAGIRYDARIHSAGKTKCADGTWRAKKGLNPVIKARVEGELLAAVPPPPVEPVATVVPPPPPVESVATVVPSPPPAAAMPVPPVAGDLTFATMLVKLTTAKLNAAQLKERCAACVPPVAEFKDLSRRPDAWPQMIAGL